jgi:hypothetical protein
LRWRGRKLGIEIIKIVIIVIMKFINNKLEYVGLQERNKMVLRGIKIIRNFVKS